MICLRTMAHAGPINALLPTTRLCWRSTMCRHPCGRLGRLNCHNPLWCRRHKSPLTNKRGAQCHWLSLRQLWHERIYRTAWLGGWPPCPVLWGVNAIVFPLRLRVLLWEHGGGIYLNGSAYSAIVWGDVIPSPKKLGTLLRQLGHRQIGCSCEHREGAHYWDVTSSPHKQILHWDNLIKVPPHAWYGACIRGTKTHIFNLSLRLVLYQFLHTVSSCLHETIHYTQQTATNTATMVAEPLAPPATRIWSIHAIQCAGNLAEGLGEGTSWRNMVLTLKLK